jgi:hypothetical protein
MAASPKIQFRVTGDTYDAIEQRRELAESASEVARTCVEFYLAFLALSLPTFSEEEAVCICQALNGILVVEPRTAQYLHASVEYEYKQGSLTTDGVDVPVLIERLRQLSLFECMAVHDAVGRFWRSEYYKKFEISERLRQIGLVASEAEQPYSTSTR